jgi:hypothetical protein
MPNVFLVLDVRLLQRPPHPPHPQYLIIKQDQIIVVFIQVHHHPVEVQIISVKRDRAFGGHVRRKLYHVSLFIVKYVATAQVEVTHAVQKHAVLLVINAHQAVYVLV